MTELPEPTISIRMLWPFARIIGEHVLAPEILSGIGIGIEQFGDPDTRLSHRVVMASLEKSIRVLDDPTLGLRAGQVIDVGELDVLEYAARSAATLGAAMRVMVRYLRIMNEAADFALAEDDGFPLWRVRPIDDTIQFPSAVNDYIVAAALSFSRRNAAAYEPPLEIRVMHERPPYAEEYAKYFDSKVVFGAPHNGLLLSKERVQVPMLRANAAVARAFELQAQRALEKLRVREGLAGRVREVLATELGDGSASMEETARRLGMGVATLRRKLDQEGTTFSDLLDEVRKQLAMRHLTANGPTVSEVAFLLGFSDVRAFARAFRRWTSQSPTEYRAATK
jgi:AraC-like DNA-binding protein